MFNRRSAFGFTLACIVAWSVLGARTSASPLMQTVSAQRAVAPLVSMHVMTMRDVRQIASATARRRPAFMPFGVGASPSEWFARKAIAREGEFAPRVLRPIAATNDLAEQRVEAQGLAPQANFDGMADSPTICPYYGGCQPPDMALGASPSWVLQAVNTAVALYGPTGALHSGWPKSMQAFFGVPNPGGCDPSGPFMTDPRALYDPADGRFWVAALQIEGAFGINSCPEQSLMWVAVSQTSDPSGAWNVYSFNMRGFSTNAAEFTAIGLDGQALYFGANVYDQTGQIFRFDEMFAASKALMEVGTPVIALGVKSIYAGKVPIDSLQPVIVQGASPPAGLFVASFNISSANCVAGCQGVNVFAMSNPLTGPKLTVRQAATPTYALAPLADQTICKACIETFDTRVAQTPVYSNGLISFALETGANNGTSTVPAVLWGQIAPKFSGATLASVKTYQTGMVAFAGDQAASFGAPMTDAAGDLVLAFDTMGSTVNPGIEYASRHATDPLGSLQAPAFLKHGPTYTGDDMWGEYSATSSEGTSTDRLWVAAEYSATGGDWATRIGALHF